VETELEGVEVEAARTGDDDLAVDHGLLGKGCAERVEELREIALQGQAVAALQVERFALAEDDAAEAIPLGLVDETGCGGDLVRGAAEHGLEGRVECGHGSDATAEAAERLGERAQHSATGLCSRRSTYSPPLVASRSIVPGFPEWPQPVTASPRTGCAAGSG